MFKGQREIRSGLEKRCALHSSRNGKPSEGFTRGGVSSPFGFGNTTLAAVGGLEAGRAGRVVLIQAGDDGAGAELGR